MVLDDDTITFIQQHVSINLATRNNENKPMLARAYGCRVDENQNSITLFLNPERNLILLENIENNHHIAVAFSRPTTHRTIQLKGNDAHKVGLEKQDYLKHQIYRKSMEEELQSIGYPLSFINALIQSIDENSVGIKFTPQAAFSQTPGPDAGKKITL